MKMRFADAGAVRAVLEGDKHILEVLAVPYGAPDRRDRLGQYFSTRTDLWLAEGDRRPVLYMHGYSPQKRKMASPPILGMAEVVRKDEAGVWMRAEIDDSDLATRTWRAAEKGQARASTGSIAHLERHDEVTGEVLMWPVVELSVFDGGENRIPVSDDAVVLPLRAIFHERGLDFPEAFEADEAEEAEEEAEPTIDDDEGEEQMDEKVEEQSAVEPDPVVPKEEPKHRAVFNVVKESVAARGLPAEKQESHEWFWHMRHGLTTGPSMRVLEETEAAEGLPLVPQDALNQIISLRNETSLASRVGMTRYQTDKLIFNLPREVTAMTALAAIDEEGAYAAQEPVFGLLPYTMQKYGKLITATEELLEDQNLFQGWLTGACARAWALAENAAMYTEADLIGSSTVGVAVASDTITQAEFSEFFWTMTTPYRDKVAFVWNTAAMALIMDLQLAAATPYAFGAYPDQARNPLGLPSINGVPVHLCNNWPAPAAGVAAGAVLSMLNPDFCGIIERRAMTIKVDPYGDALNGRIRYFPSVRFHCFFSQALAHVVKEGV